MDNNAVKPLEWLAVKKADDERPLFTDLGRKWELDGHNPTMRLASIFYMRPDEMYSQEKPYFLNVPPEPSWAPAVTQTNVKYTRKWVAVADIRGRQDMFSIDRHGFQLGHFESSLSYDEYAVAEVIASRYYDEVKAFLIKATGADEVLPFDYQVRRSDTSIAVNSRGAPGKAQPFSAIHGDQTANAAIRRLLHFHPEYANRYQNGRFQIVNVWKPLRGPVYDFPLAMCDYRTVQDDDRVPCDVVFPDYLGETYSFWPNPQHRLYYIDGQQSNEAWMVKCFDSATASDPKIAQFAPHVAFPYLTAEEHMPRESIEVRTFVFYRDEQGAEGKGSE